MRPAGIFAFVALGLILTGCAQPTNVKFGFEFAGPDTYLYPMATGVIALKANDARNEKFCEAIVKNMKPVGDLEKSSSVALNIIRTRFIISTNTALSISPDDPAKSCQAIMSAYSLAIAGTFLNQVNAPTGQGPFLVALVPNSKNAIIIDASASSEGDFDTIVFKWEQAVDKSNTDTATGGASIWHSLFQIVTAAINLFFPAGAGTWNVITTTVQGAVCPP